jgi:hypothetical protein
MPAQRLGGANASRFGGRGQFVHNQFAAARFHGLHNFNRAGFNRNAFGGCQIGTAGAASSGEPDGTIGAAVGAAGAGSVFWQFLYGDVFSFAFWPCGYYGSVLGVGPRFPARQHLRPGPIFRLRIWSRLQRLCRIVRHLLRPSYCERRS